MTLVLHGHPFSSYTQKVLIALYENATPFTWRVLDGPAAFEELASLWPIGLMPVLVDDATPIAESSIIIEHLALNHAGGVRLIPADPRMALKVRLLDRFLDLYVMTPMQKIVGDRLRRAGEIPKESPMPAPASRSLTVGWRKSWPGASGRPASTSRWPIAPPRPRCSTPTGRSRSMTGSSMSAATVRAC